MQRFFSATLSVLNTAFSFYFIFQIKKDPDLSVLNGNSEYSMRTLSAYFYDPLLRHALRSLRRAVREQLPEDRKVRILDICCGTGEQLYELQKAGYRDLSGLDLSAAMLAVATRKSPLLKLVEGDALDQPFPDASFDVVLISLALHDKSEKARQQILEEIHRLLKPAGISLVADFCFDGRSFFRGRIAIRLVEGVAGGEHYKNFRSYIRRGGLPGILPENLFKHEEAARTTNNSIAVWRLRPCSL
jgi:ubiquinone/menaquinone biosynthesis C-methylase UbiE